MFSLNIKFLYVFSFQVFFLLFKHLCKGWVSLIKSPYSECSIFGHPPSQLISCLVTNCRESNYIAKYSPSPIYYPLKPVELWNVGLLGVGLSSIHNYKISLLILILIFFVRQVDEDHLQSSFS